MIETLQLQELASQVWLTTLNLDVIGSQRVMPASQRELVSAAVTIDGGWVGRVDVTCTRGAAAAAASSLFHCDPETLLDADLLDAIGEVANVTGGAIKPLLPGECQLHPPVATFSGDWPTQAGTAFLRLGDESIAVRVVPA